MIVIVQVTQKEWTSVFKNIYYDPNSFFNFHDTGLLHSHWTWPKPLDSNGSQVHQGNLWLSAYLSYVVAIADDVQKKTAGA